MGRTAVTALLGALLTGCGAKVWPGADAAPDHGRLNELTDGAVPHDLPDAAYAETGFDVEEQGSDVVARDRPPRCGEEQAACCAAPTEPCGEGLVCFEGRCEACAVGTTRCGTSCHELARDRDHCGACGRTCAADEVCPAGRCQPPCQSGQTRCAGDTVCVTDFATHPRHCGACGRACTSPPGSRTECVAGACLTTACTANDCDRDPANGAETDTLTDPCNCGACGLACDDLRGVAEARCVDCACQVTRCDLGYANCDGQSANGCETYVRGDAMHCGGCGRVCPVGQRCVEGSCVPREGLVRCGPRLANLFHDRDHCGRCDQRCPAAQVCDQGRCVQRCAAAADSCGRETCIDLAWSNLHCGRCGNRCAEGGPPCFDGECRVTCAIGLTLCMGRCADLAFDNQHCGACGYACPQGSLCRHGACHAPRCLGGRRVP